MVTTFYPPYGFGGDANFVQNLALLLAGRGHQVDVIHCLDSFRALSRKDRREQAAEHPNLTVHCLESGWGTLSPLATHQTGRPLLLGSQIQQILDQGFDVIHYHNVSLIGGPAILSMGVAVKLYTWHEYWLLCPTSLLMKNGTRPCEKPTCVSCTIRQGRPPQWWRYSGLLERCLGSIDAFLSPSRFAIARHQDLPCAAPRFHLPNFVPDVAEIDTATRISSSSPAATQPPYFLYAGRLEPVKGTHTLVDHFLRWRGAKLVIAGAGSQLEQLRAQVAAVPGGDRYVEFTGKLPIDRLRELYRDAVAVVLPSESYEVFPLVILEAFRESTPVIVHNIGSLPEPVEDSGGGFTYDTGEQLVAYAKRLLEDRDLRDRMGRLGLQALEGRWSADAHLERYMGIIATLREKRGAAEEVLA